MKEEETKIASDSVWQSMILEFEPQSGEQPLLKVQSPPSYEAAVLPEEPAEVTME